MPAFQRQTDRNVVTTLTEVFLGLIRFGGQLPDGDTMSRPWPTRQSGRTQRQFTDEFKASAVRLVLDEGKTVGATARDLDLTETAMSEWVKRARADRTHGRPGAHDRRARGVGRLRKENRILQEERDILRNESRAWYRPTCGPETPWCTLVRPRLWPFAFW